MRQTDSGNTTASRRRIAVVGAGISGLSAAWLLSRNNDVVLYEADRRLGGHAHTVEAATPSGPVAVDTGFIVYNDRNYPNLVALFDHLRVPTLSSTMSFAASLDGGAFEYSGSGISGMLGQRSNVLRPRFWRMLSDILRFYRAAPALLSRAYMDDTTLGEYLDAAGYSSALVEDHLLPMGAAIWSTTAQEMRAYPLKAFLRFFASHGLLSLSDRPQWRTVAGGSRAYVQRLAADFRGEIRLDCPVAAIVRDHGGVLITDSKGHSDRFCDVVVATHADQALAMLTDGDAAERSSLGAFQYTRNTAVLHSDTRLMPKRRKVWSSWNYIGDRARDGERPLCVSYWMNMLQGLPEKEQVFVTLNPIRDIAAEKIYGSYAYAHPLFNHAALEAQTRLSNLQGRRNTWFCGAHFGSGFHEDGLQSGLAVAESLGGGKRPWTVENESGRIAYGDMRLAAE